MKKFFPYILILTIVVGGFIPIYNIEAQGVPCTGFDVEYTPLPPGCDPNLPLPAGVSEPSIVPESPCGISSWGLCVVNGLLRVLSFILYLILSIMALFLYLAGTLLDFVLKWTILDLKVNLDGLTGINITWKLIKDLMNIVFIFMLVYQGIKLIISQESSDNIKRFIAMLVLASLLINFSLFFTKVLIDASNIFTVSFYNSIITSASDINIGGNRISGISVPFMKNMGLSNFWSTGSFDQTQATTAGNTSMVIFPIMGIIIFLITMFSFFSVAMMFIIRYITLIILLILSPVAYMGMALPGMSGYAKQWWESLQGQLLFGPIYMIMTWVILQLMGTSGFTVNRDWGSVIGSAQTANSLATQPSISLVFNFIIIIGLIIATLVIAKSTASKGSKYIGDYTNHLTTFAGNRIMGGAGTLGRNTIGRTADRATQSEWLKNTAVNGNAVTRNLAKFTLKKADKTAQSSFDVRSTSGFTGLSKTAGLTFGKGADSKKVNFRKLLDEKGEAEGKFAKMLKPSDSVLAEREVEQKAADKIKDDTKKSYEESTKEIKNKKDRIERLKENINKAENFDEREKIKNEIAILEKDVKDKQLGLDELRMASENAKKASEAYKESTESIFTDRVKTYANSFSNETALWTWSKNALRASGVGAGAGIATSLATGAGPALSTIVGGTTAGLIMTGNYRTSRDNKAIARKILKDTKTKSDSDQLAELAKKVAKKEAEEKGETIDEGGEKKVEEGDAAKK